MSDPDLKLINCGLSPLPPGIETLDMLLPDSNGVLRGKRLTAAALEQACRDGLPLPGSLYSLELDGRQAALRDFPHNEGDRDYRCFPIGGSVTAAPWLGAGAAQCLVEMYDGDAPLAVSPRAVLRRCIERLAAAGLSARVAVELEFYLLEAGRDDDGRPVPAANPAGSRTERAPRVYEVSELDDFSTFLATVTAWAAAMQLPVTALQGEYGAGQFEINLACQDDPLHACDQALLFKRLVKEAARAHGLRATFMARPRADQPGSGLHLHINVNNSAGGNLFAASPATLRHAIAGLQRHLDDSLLLLAPHANSYRRLAGADFTAADRSWGRNDRRAALRIPVGDGEATRLEHRVAGADANPYLAMAAVLAGIGSGLAEDTEPLAPGAAGATAPASWQAARERFAASSWARESFGEAFCASYAALKLSEQQAFDRVVTPCELDWGLDTA